MIKFSILDFCPKQSYSRQYFDSFSSFGTVLHKNIKLKKERTCFYGSPCKCLFIKYSIASILFVSASESHVLDKNITK